MRAMKILKQQLTPFLASIHKNRLAAVFWAVQALMLGGRLSLTAIGRRAKGSAFVKHNIKRVDRLLGNNKLHLETAMFFYGIASILIGAKRRPVILVDWTPAGLKHAALYAAVPVDGRALTVYAEVHPLSKLSNAKVQRDFLRKLHMILPTECRPIIVTDAGFKTNWFNDVLAWDWDIVGRVRGRIYLCEEHNRKWITAKKVFRRAVFRPKDMGRWFVTQSNPICLRLVSVKKNKRTKTKIRGQECQRRARRQAMEPWLLVTSLETATAKKIVDIYATRMQIEETFRDTKNHRFGWSFEDARSQSSGRIMVLLLLAVLGMMATTQLGQAAESRGLEKNFQANRTSRARRVLSLFFLGKNILQRGEDTVFDYSELQRSLSEIEKKIMVLETDNVSDYEGIP